MARKIITLYRSYVSYEFIRFGEDHHFGTSYVVDYHICRPYVFLGALCTMYFALIHYVLQSSDALRKLSHRSYVSLQAGSQRLGHEHLSSHYLGSSEVGATQPVPINEEHVNYQAKLSLANIGI